MERVEETWHREGKRMPLGEGLILRNEQSQDLGAGRGGGASEREGSKRGKR